MLIFKGMLYTKAQVHGHGCVLVFREVGMLHQCPNIEKKKSNSSGSLACFSSEDPTVVCIWFKSYILPKLEKAKSRVWYYHD